VLLEGGDGVPQDEPAAVRYYQMAAEYNHARAQRRLGFCLEAGRGTPKDKAAAGRPVLSWRRIRETRSGDANGGCIWFTEPRACNRTRRRSLSSSSLPIMATPRPSTAPVGAGHRPGGGGQRV
jgi:hypothetical protein